MKTRISSTPPVRLLAIGAALVLFSSTSPHVVAGTAAAATSMAAAQGRANAPGQQKRYRATRPIVSDRTTGNWRMPTAEEVTEVVSNLVTLTNRPGEGLPQTQGPDNTVVVNLEGGFGGVLLARPNEDGTLETRCVFTFEEGAEFLGLVEDVQ